METLKLRPFTEDDATSLVQHLSNKRIWNQCCDHLPWPYTQHDAQAFIAHCQQDKPNHQLCIEVDGQAVGCIGYTPQTDVLRLNGKLGFWISELHWGKGIMTAAVQQAVRRFFAQSDMQRIFAYVFETNPSSMQVLQKAGFRKVGTLRNAIIKNNILMDAVLYEILRQDIA